MQERERVEDLKKSSTGACVLKWPKLVPGTLLRRYQRFKADVRLRNGHVVTALCPNTGSMLGCSEPGTVVYLSRHDRAERKLKYTWEMIHMPGSLVGVNTTVPNELVKQTIKQGGIEELQGFESIRTEVGYGRTSRIDILLEKGEEKCFVEIKNCTLAERGIAYFPDAVTTRGLKHLVELQKQVAEGHRSVMFYLVQRMDAKKFRPADHIDEAYGQELRKAFFRGVEILVYDVNLDLEGISLRSRLPHEL
ncbi:MAG: DNA/RNA nuclease SfsA [Deltaproteobacteria bacterium]|nr:DNA/RNA nuclease SfsA [Deltaproteobacteria bacterium]